MERGFTLWFTGLSGAGKSTLARRVEAELRARGRRVEVLDGDIVRTHLSTGLGFSRADRDTNILRIGFVCELLSRNGVIALAAAISPYRATRDEVRKRIGSFVEVYVECPLEECERRDVKGLYAQARAGQLRAFTGVDDPYEPPLAPEIVVSTARQTTDESVQTILRWLERNGLLFSSVDPVPVLANASAASAAAVDASPGTNGHHNGLPPAAAAYTTEEEAEVSARLEALGYL